MDILMEEQMNFILMPSLQRRALIKTVITVWNQDDVIAFTAEMIKSKSFIKRQEKGQVVEDKLIEKLQVLPLPESLKIRLISFVKPILWEVLRWWDCHGYLSLFLRFDIEILNKICWTPQGTIDRKKTAEAMIRDEKLSIDGRYEIACAYCLKKDILMLWSKIPENDRKCFYSELLLPHSHKPLVYLWTSDIQGKMNRMENFTRIEYRCTPYQYALKRSVRDGNQVATEYILSKLTTEEREKSLVESAKKFCIFTPHRNFCRPVDVLFFYLSQMNEEQQIEVLKNYPCAVLSCLLCWPWQGFFMKMAQHVQAFLPKDDFYRLLQLIIKKVKDGFKDYDYQYLFREFWQQSPITHKEHIIFIGRHIESFSLLDLLQIKDKGNIKLILEDLTTPDREKVIFSTCERLVCKYEIDSLEFFVQECLTAIDITIKFREFVKHKILYGSKETLEKHKNMWSKVSQLLDDLTQKCDNKRCVEDGNSGPAKRFCS